MHHDGDTCGALCNFPATACGRAKSFVRYNFGGKADGVLSKEDAWTEELAPGGRVAIPGYSSSGSGWTDTEAWARVLEYLGST